MKARYHRLLLSTLAITSIVALVIPLLSMNPVQATLTSHAPISINGDTQLEINANGGGDGTSGNPYVIENYVISAASADGIDILNTASYFVVRNCLIENGAGSYNGIYLENVTNGKIDNCVFNNNYIDTYLASSSNNTLTNNTCENSSYLGAYLASSSNNTLTNNTCENNFYDIYLASSSNNTLTNNTCENNSYFGIYLDYNSNNNLISSNAVENAGYGISLYSSDNNLIYHNNFTSNSTQAIDDSSNTWDNGYPSGGNYWNDYAGMDENHGENQNMPGGDGIGDTPYEIFGGGDHDRYPLMNPWPCVIENYSSFDLNLITGWNLVCFTALGGSDIPNNIFAPLVYNTDYLMYHWTAPGGPYVGVNPTTALLDNRGYWVNMKTTNKVVSTAGTRPSTENISLVVGWNLVGFPVVGATTTPENIFAPLVYNTDYLMYHWTAPGGPYVGVNPTTALLDNRGYWVNMKTTNKTVTVP